MAKSIVDKLFAKYQYMANIYAGRVFSYESLGMERQDIVQEMSIKIYQSILAYGEKWGRYRRGEEKKPMPLKTYIQTALSNKVLDFVRLVDRHNVTTPMSEFDFDYGCEDTSSIDEENNVYILNGVDVNEGLRGKDRAVFTMFIRGYRGEVLKRISVDATKIIKRQQEFLLGKYGAELTAQTHTYRVTSYDD